LFGFGSGSVVWRVKRDYVYGIADVALDVIACAIWVAYLLSAYSTDE